MPPRNKKLNAFGRASHKKHIQLYAWMMDSPAWRSLSLGARSLLLEVWYRHNGQNNGQISMSVREAARLLNCGRNTPMKLFDELQEKGFLEATKRGSFDWKVARDHPTNKGRATTWRLTMERCNGDPATKEFMRWRPEKKQSAVTPAVTNGHSEGDTEMRKSPPKTVNGHAGGDHSRL